MLVQVLLPLPHLWGEGLYLFSNFHVLFTRNEMGECTKTVMQFTATASSTGLPRGWDQVVNLAGRVGMAPA